MFGLDRQIVCWREKLAQAEVYGQSDLDELEAHFREEVAALVRQGLSEQEAFTVACMRIGEPQDLEPEFAKVNGAAVFRRRLFWMAGGVLGLGYANLAGMTVSRGAAMLAVRSGMRGYAAGITAQSIHVLVVAAIVVGLLALARWRPALLAAPAWLRSRGAKAATFMGLLALNLAMLFFPSLFTAGTLRMMGPQEYGQLALVTGYANLVITIAWSCILIAWVVKAWPSTATR